MDRGKEALIRRGSGRGSRPGHSKHALHDGGAAQLCRYALTPRTYQLPLLVAYEAGFGPPTARPRSFAPPAACQAAQPDSCLTY